MSVNRELIKKINENYDQTIIIYINHFQFSPKPFCFYKGIIFKASQSYPYDPIQAPNPKSPNNSPYLSVPLNDLWIQRVNSFNFKNKNNSSKQMQNNNGSPVANFVQKTFEILKIDDYRGTIQWMPNGKEFIIRNSDAFEGEVLPKYFRHRNVNSFIRQLNMYGFHKSRKQPNKLIFSHPAFLEGRDDLLPSVRRKIKNQDREQHQDQEREEDNKTFEIPHAASNEQSETMKTFSKQTILQQEPLIFTQEKSIFAINSFFNIDYEHFQLRNLISKSFAIHKNFEAYQRIEQAPSLKEIGTEQFLSYCDKHSFGNGQDLYRNSAIPIFETKNCIFQLDI